jgi:hypothetical protein
MLQIEADCAWAMAKDTWTDDVRHHLTAEKKESIEI